MRRFQRSQRLQMFVSGTLKERRMLWIYYLAVFIAETLHALLQILNNMENWIHIEDLIIFQISFFKFFNIVKLFHDRTLYVKLHLSLHLHSHSLRYKLSLYDGIQYRIRSESNHWTCMIVRPIHVIRRGGRMSVKCENEYYVPPWLNFD